MSFNLKTPIINAISDALGDMPKNMTLQQYESLAEEVIEGVNLAVEQHYPKDEACENVEVDVNGL